MEVGMLNSFKNKAAEQDKGTAPYGLEFVQPQRSVAETVTPRPERAKSEPDSYIGSGMSVVGKIECDGSSAESKASCALRIS
jgi:hypothetical protein